MTFILDYYIILDLHSIETVSILNEIRLVFLLFQDFSTLTLYTLNNI